MHRQHVFSGLDQRVATQGGEDVIKLKIVLHDCFQWLRQFVGVIGQEPAGDVVGGEEGAQVQQIGGGRRGFGGLLERQIPGRRHRDRVLGSVLLSRVATSGWSSPKIRLTISSDRS